MQSSKLGTGAVPLYSSLSTCLSRLVRPAKVRVSGTIDGVPYSGKLFKYGSPHHMLGVLKSLRTQIGKGPGGYRNDHVETCELMDAPPLVNRRAFVDSDPVHAA